MPALLRYLACLVLIFTGSQAIAQTTESDYSTGTAWPMKYTDGTWMYIRRPFTINFTGSGGDVYIKKGSTITRIKWATNPSDVSPYIGYWDVYEGSYSGATAAEPRPTVGVNFLTLLDSIQVSQSSSDFGTILIPGTLPGGPIASVYNGANEFAAPARRLILPRIEITFDRSAGTFTVSDPSRPPAPPDNDGDGDSDEIDPDDDNDGIPDNQDPSPRTPNNNPDSDKDGLPDWKDPDDDDDGTPDTQDPAPFDPDIKDPDPAPNLTTDTDGDGVPNYIDSDDDNDGISDTFDRYPRDPSNGGKTDTSGDGSDGGGGTPEGPEDPGDGGVGGMNRITEGDTGEPGEGKPFGDPVGDIESTRAKMAQRLANYRLIASGALPRATSYNFHVDLPPFGNINKNIDFTASPFPMLRLAILLCFILMFGNAFLKRATI